MPTPSGLLRAGDKFYHDSEPGVMYEVVSRQGNDSMYSIRFRRIDGRPFDFSGNGRRMVHLMIGPISYKFEHMGWHLVEGDKPLQFAELTWQSRWNESSASASLSQNGPEIMATGWFGWVMCDLRNKADIEAILNHTRQFANMLEEAAVDFYGG